MQIRCPHCHVVIELVDEVAGSDVTCPKCGSRVSSAEATFIDPVSVGPADAVAEQTWSYHAHEAAAMPKSDPVSADQPNLPPEENDESRFGRFRLLKRLGRGSFGEVWLADDPQLQRQVALKFPRAGKQKNFHWEAQAAARLRHPHIVTVFEVGEETDNGQPNWPYIASEYIPSQDLAKVLKPKLDEPSHSRPSAWPRSVAKWPRRCTPLTRRAWSTAI